MVEKSIARLEKYMYCRILREPDASGDIVIHKIETKPPPPPPPPQSGHKHPHNPPRSTPSPRTNEQVTQPEIFSPEMHSDSLFWCLYVGKNGYAEYASYVDMMRDRIKNFEMDMKRKIVEDIGTRAYILTNRASKTEYKFTKKKICEISSRMTLANVLTDTYTCLALCKMFGIGVYLVNKSRKTYMVMNTCAMKNTDYDHDDDNHDDDNHDNDDDDDDNHDAIETLKKTQESVEQPRFFLVYYNDDKDKDKQKGKYKINNPRPVRYSIDLQSTFEKRDYIVQTYEEVILGEKPLRAIAYYKKNDLESILNKLNIALPVEPKMKKKDLYDKLWEYLHDSFV